MKTLAARPALALGVFLFGATVHGRAAWDTFSDTWLATDGLGRALPAYDEVGPAKTNRSVGMFYFLWMNGGTVYDITQILAANPTNPPWGPRHAFHFWGRPLFDYYRSNDRYVHRKHAQMLADAGVDALFFDVSNGFTYDPARQALCEEFESFRVAGHRVPTLSFLTHSSASNTVQAIYDRFYAPGLFPELWLRWKGRPLMLARASEVNPALESFFNFRYSWAWDPGQDKWPWIDHYPQRFGWHESPSVAEELPVCVAQHPTSNIGRSFNGGAEPPPGSRDPAIGLCFAEQWSRALSVGAEMTFVTGWNEWIAQRFISGLDGSPSFLGAPTTNGQSFFVDAYNQEFSRDLEPMAGGHGDNYYYQLVANVRRLKGVRPIEPVRSWPMTINSAFDDWAFVRPEFRDHVGDAARRNHPGYDSAVTLVNQSGRNDLVLAKVSADANHVHFYVRTAAPLTPKPVVPTNWMLLFIDADTNAQTGWLGYDFVVGRQFNSGTSVGVERHAGGTGYVWTAFSEGQIHFAGNELALSIPRSVLTNSTFDFKWADGIASSGHWSDFTLNGDVAPNDRFNYRAILTTGCHPLVSAGATWKFNDTGANLGTAWRAPGYNDLAWPAGPAQLGYGDGDEATFVGYGPNANNKYVTTYFRHAFHVGDASVFTNLTLRLLRDDGAVVWLNGVELARQNLPAGGVSAATLASSAVANADEWRYFETNVSAAALLNGTNVLAVEIHQNATNSSDLSFDLELLGNGGLPFAVALTAPTTDTTIPASRFSLEAVSSRPATVEFQVNGQPFAQAAAAPYRVASASLPPGTYSITASATDAQGRRACSAPATVRIRSGPETLLSSNAAWMYYDKATNLGTAWRALSYPDSSWGVGPAQLGFGDGDESTLIASNRQITTYFRHKCAVADSARFTNLTARLLRDDGAVVFLNNLEVWRHNLPAGAIAFDTPASAATPEENTWFTTNLSRNLLVSGQNILAVEVHQNSATSSDVSFAFELLGDPGPAPPTSLAAVRRENSLLLQWPAATGMFQLQTATNVAPPIPWSAATNAPVLSNNAWQVVIPVSGAGSRFYRLRAPSE